MQTSALSFSSDEQKALYLKHMAEHCSSQFKRLQGKLLPIHKRMDKYAAELEETSATGRLVEPLTLMWREESTQPCLSGPTCLSH